MVKQIELTQACREHGEELVHISYLGKYLGLSYILKKKRNEIKPKEYKIIKTKGWEKGKITRVLKVDNDKIKTFFNGHKHYKLNDAGIQVRLKSQLNDAEKAIVGRGKKLPLISINKSNSCECGCKCIAIDYDKGDIFCPECGLMEES